MGYTKVEGDKLDLSKRQYQNNAYDNMIKILFNNISKYNRYAALIFPTGGGKSYMACGLVQYMAQAKKKDEKLKVLFVSPTNPINSQFGKNISENLQVSSDNIKLDTFCYAKKRK